MRVVIADDSGIFREGLRLLLEAEGVEVTDDVADVDSLYRAVELHRPDACIVDIRMPPTHGDEGVRAAEHLRRVRPELAVLVLSTYADAAWAERLLAGGEGRVGYLLKDRVADGDQLLDALGRVVSGGTVIDPDIVSALIRRPRRDNPLDRLTERERDVLALMAEGKSNAGIASALFLSPKTVEGHAAAVFTKLGLLAESRGVSENRRVLAVLTYLEQTQRS